MSAEHARLIGNLLMIGVVRELDEAGSRVRVDADGMLTDWIPWLERRAGPGMRSWCAPEPGEQVVLACPYGDPGQALVLGSLYQNRFPAPPTHASCSARSTPTAVSSSTTAKPPR